MANIFTRMFWRDTAERVLSSAAQGAITGIGGAVLIQQYPWAVIGGTAASFATLTFLKCLIASRIGDEDSASLDPSIAVIDAS